MEMSMKKPVRCFSSRLSFQEEKYLTDFGINRNTAREKPKPKTNKLDSRNNQMGSMRASKKGEDGILSINFWQEMAAI